MKKRQFAACLLILMEPDVSQINRNLQVSYGTYRRVELTDPRRISLFMNLALREPVYYHNNYVNCIVKLILSPLAKTVFVILDTFGRAFYWGEISQL